MVQIYFDTSTFVEIEKDRKLTMEAQLGAIGGTMGLFTGFSILSAVQIIYFLGRMFMSLINKKVSAKVRKVKIKDTTQYLTNFF